MSKAVQKENHLPHTEKIPCAFCKGTGKDPFGQLYPGSTCQVCSGREEIYVSAPYKTCAYCHGSGVEFSTQNTCTACGGRGAISLGHHHLKGTSCKSCNGSGMNVQTNLPCAPCHGLGCF